MVGMGLICSSERRLCVCTKLFSNGDKTSHAGGGIAEVTDSILRRISDLITSTLDQFGDPALGHHLNKPMD